MFDFARVFHTGVRVDDVDEAMAELGPTLAITWASVQHIPDRSLWTPDRGLEHVALTFVYSCEGPQHIELLRGTAGSVWDCGESPGLHHVGVWSDDVVGDVDRFRAAGWAVTAAAAAPDDGYGSFAYVESPSGSLVELVTAAAQARFEEWWAGGAMGSERDQSNDAPAHRRDRRPAPWRRRGTWPSPIAPHAGTDAGSPASRCSWDARNAPPATARRPTTRTPGRPSARPDRRRSCTRWHPGSSARVECWRATDAATAPSRVLRHEPDRAGDDDQRDVSAHR